MNTQIPLFGSDPGQESPLVYVATRLTHLDQDGRAVIDGWCYVIRETIEHLAHEGWLPRIHLPIKRSAPWKDDGMIAAEVYNLNSGLLWRDVDALIVLAYGGGGLGAGNELTTAVQLGIPTFVVSHTSEPLSRHITGMAGEYLVTLATFTESEDLRDVVDRWLRGERRRIDDGPRRRRTRAVRIARLSGLIEREWQRLGPKARREVQAISGIAATRIERILEHPSHLDAASFHEIASLTGALAIDLEQSAFGKALPELDDVQQGALVSAAEEYGWSPRETLEVVRAARVELAKPAIRRIRLTSMQDWLRFAEIHRSR